MPQSLACVYVHAVFSTKDRTAHLANPEFRQRVMAYIAEIIRKQDCAVVEVGGFDDHIHILCRLSRTITIADLLKETKRVSSHFVKDSIPEFSWQGGYAAFSVDPTRLSQIARYIRTQPEHHATTDFKDELRALLTEHGLDWDERYLWE